MPARLKNKQRAHPDEPFSARLAIRASPGDRQQQPADPAGGRWCRGAALEGTRYYLEKLQVRTPPPHPTARSRVPSGDAPSTSSKTHVPSCSQPPGSQRPETGDSWRVDKLECHHTMN